MSPPQLELADPEHPLVTVYVVNIREPTFAPWYIFAGRWDRSTITAGHQRYGQF